MSGGDYYIVTTRNYRRFESVEAAQTQRDKFHAQHPSTPATIIRCKTKLKRANHYQAMVAMLQAFVHQGATGENIERGKALLEAIKHRHPEVSK